MKVPSRTDGETGGEASGYLPFFRPDASRVEGGSVSRTTILVVASPRSLCHEPRPQRSYRYEVVRSLGVKHNLITCSFVGVWNMPLGEFQVDAKAWQDIFGDPFTTQIGPSPEGLSFRKLGKPPQPAVVVGPQRVIVTAPSIAEAAQIYEKVKAILDTALQGRIPLFADVGLNSEHEWIELDTNLRPAQAFLAKRFVRGAMHELNGDAVFEALSFRLKLSSGLNLGVRMEPRADRNDGVFVAINDHRQWNKAMPSPSELSDVLAQSIENVRRLDTLLLGGAIGHA